MFRCSSETLWNTPNDETRIIFFSSITKQLWNPFLDLQTLKMASKVLSY